MLATVELTAISLRTATLARPFPVALLAKPDPMDFSISMMLDPPTATLTANGELDIFTAREVSRQLSDAIGAGCRQLLVDVGGVTFVDASALGVFDRARREMTAHDGTIGFVAASVPFRRLCALTGLDTVFELN